MLEGGGMREIGLVRGLSKTMVSLPWEEINSSCSSQPEGGNNGKGERPTDKLELGFVAGWIEKGDPHDSRDVT